MRMISRVLLLFAVLSGLATLPAFATDPWQANLASPQRPEHYAILLCWDPTTNPPAAVLCGNASHPLSVTITSLLGGNVGVLNSANGRIDPATTADIASVLAKLSSDPATQTTLAAVLAKLSSDPATQTTLAAVLAKLSSDPATQTTLAAILAKITSDPATSSKQDIGNTNTGAIATGMTTLVAQTSHFPAALGQVTQAQSLPVVLPSDPDSRPASGNITVIDSGSTTTAGFNSVNYITGPPTAGSFKDYAINGQSSATCTISGTWTGTLSFEISGNSGTYVASTMRQRGGSYRASSVTGNGVFDGDVSGKTNLRVRATGAITGTAVVQCSFSGTSGPIQVQNPISLFDNSSNAQATIKAASTPPASTDTSIVVGLNPNAPLPAGTNLLGKTGIDQTTPGSSNGVVATNFPATVSTGAGATGASSPRNTVAQDATTIAGSPPGTAGTPSASVLTAQGVPGGTPLNVTPDSVQDGVTTSAAVTSATTVLTFTATQLQGMHSIAFGFSGVGGGATVVVDVAADGTNFNAPVIFWRTDSATGSAIASLSTPTTAMQFVVPVTGQAMRIRLSAYTSGTYTGYATLKRGSAPLPGSIIINSSGNGPSVQGTAGVGATPAGSPIRFGAAYNSAGVSAVDGKMIDLQAENNGGIVISPYAVQTNRWSYSAASGGISNTTSAVTLVAADATRKNCLTDFQLMSGALGVATEIVIRDGAGGTVVWRGILSTAGLSSDNVHIDNPICNASVNTLLEFATLTATVTGAVYVNAQGFKKP